MRDSFKLFLFCFLCLLNLCLAILINDLFYVLSLFFGILIILFKFSRLENLILENKNISEDSSEDSKSENEKLDQSSADEHPIIVSARKRLNKNNL